MYYFNWTFSPECTITRSVSDVTITSLDRPAVGSYPDTAITITNSQGYTLTGFADASKVGKWFVDGMKWAVAEGLITGTTSGRNSYLTPQGEATREQVAAILMRFSQNVAK